MKHLYIILISYISVKFVYFFRDEQTDRDVVQPKISVNNMDWTCEKRESKKKKRAKKTIIYEVTFLKRITGKEGVENLTLVGNTEC